MRQGLPARASLGVWVNAAMLDVVLELGYARGGDFGKIRDISGASFQGGVGNWDWGGAGWGVGVLGFVGLCWVGGEGEMEDGGWRTSRVHSRNLDKPRSNTTKPSHGSHRSIAVLTHGNDRVD